MVYQNNNICPKCGSKKSWLILAGSVKGRIYCLDCGAIIEEGEKLK